MKYIALLRGINVGGNNRVEMKRLTALMEMQGYMNVSTYINSGNIFFESAGAKKVTRRDIEEVLKKEFGFDVPAIIKTQKEIQEIAAAIPKGWKNDTEQKSDVAYLFEDIDSEKVIDELPFNKDFVDVRYITGALIWNVKRENLGKSRLNKIVGHKLYKFMTLRNVNTARFLASSNVAS